MKSQHKIILILILISVISITIGLTYYHLENQKVDKRVIAAREYYSSYNETTSSYDFVTLLNLLNKIENVYQQVPHYRNSYELSVVENNRSAIMLTIALFRDSAKTMTIPDSFQNYNFVDLLNLANAHSTKALEGYQIWNTRFQNLNDSQLESEVRKDFFDGFSESNLRSREKALQKRIKEIKTAREEVNRRLSVAYTNRGVIARHLEDYQEAARCYKIALELWSENLDAENNLNILLNQPIRRKGVIEKLFPPEK
ncbi:MAG: tetratricopeptide repeat protein [Bacteroidales bacterium]|nr:tetratricopeptide repeat protein [Bacteroidales bacterium]